MQRDHKSAATHNVFHFSVERVPAATGELAVHKKNFTAKDSTSVPCTGAEHQNSTRSEVNPMSCRSSNACCSLSIYQVLTSRHVILLQGHSSVMFNLETTTAKDTKIMPGPHLALAISLAVTVQMCKSGRTVILPTVKYTCTAKVLPVDVEGWQQYQQQAQWKSW